MNLNESPLFALLFAGDEVVQVLPLGGAVADEWSMSRLEPWAEALVSSMPVADDITRIVVFRVGDAFVDVER